MGLHGLLQEYLYFIWGGVRLSPLGTWPIIQAPDCECGVVGGIRIVRGNRSSRRKPAPVLLCPPQISHDLNRARTRAAAVGAGTNRLSYAFNVSPNLNQSMFTINYTVLT
jgi:hypothetical protein